VGRAVMSPDRLAGLAGLVDRYIGYRLTGFTVRDLEGNLWSFGTYAGE
jgi:hypothetical protein